MLFVEHARIRTIFAHFELLFFNQIPFNAISNHYFFLIRFRLSMLPATRRPTYRRGIYPPPVSLVTRLNKTLLNDFFSSISLESIRCYQQGRALSISPGRGARTRRQLHSSRCQCRSRCSTEHGSSCKAAGKDARSEHREEEERRRGRSSRSTSHANGPESRYCSQ